MASFTNSLRLRNMFPVNTDLGNARIDLSGIDPMQEVFAEYDRRVQQSMPTPTGIRQLSAMRSPRMMEEPELKFGGVVNSGNNPGADILNRAKARAEQTYDNYSKPALTAGEILGKAGIEPNDQFPTQRPEFMLKNKAVDADIANDIRRISNEERRLRDSERRTDLMEDSKGWKVGAIQSQDGKTINVRYNEVTGEVEPLKLDNGQGTLSRLGTPDKTTQPRNIADIRRTTQEGLDLINSLIDEKTGELTPEAARATGWSSFGNVIPGSKGLTGSESIKRLKDLLTLNLIGEMKAQSRTGATGFGALNLRELGVLEGGASKLGNLRQDDNVIKDELIRLRDKLKLIMQEEMPNSSTTPNRSDWMNRDNSNPNKLLDTNRPENRIKVKDPSGRTGTWPANKTLPPGFERVQ